MKKLIAFFLALFATGLALQAGSVSSGEKVTITIKGVPASEQASINGEYVVADNGLLYMPMLKSGVKASGSSSSTVARRIEEAYKGAKIYSNPRITIITVRDEIKLEGIGKRENQFVTVSGEVKRDGPVQYRNGMTIYEAIATAGGVDTFGAMNRVVLERNGRETKIDLKTSEGRRVKVQVGDNITVPQKNAFGR
ncbi:polysaccharide biosynthesis/export family protein [Rubritalea tangerina]|uniref:Polysaccharide biosynthesis/export family protein n=1 Tax=Rubritalea tangerina TaxID=430798 RepID=A0ABW4ZDK9_9BACT